jgi:hypothetical protein
VEKEKTTTTKTTATRSSVLSKLVNEVLNVEHFESLADLAEAVKCRAARLHIPYDSTRVAEAIDLVGRKRELFSKPEPPPPSTRPAERWPVESWDAREILQQLGARVRGMK